MDLKQPDAVRIVHEIATTSDVVVNNWRIGVLERLGFGYAQLKTIKPDIIFVTASTFGPKGPWAGKPGRDVLGQAASGIMDVTGYEGEIPLPVGSAVADHTSGMVEALAILAALRYRDQTGHGQEVDVSLYGTAIAMQAWEVTHHAITREPIRRAGRGHTLITSGTWGAFETADGYLCLGGVMPDQWPRFCQILDAERLIDDPRFATAEMLTAMGPSFATSWTRSSPPARRKNGWGRSKPTRSSAGRSRTMTISSTAIRRCSTGISKRSNTRRSARSRSWALRSECPRLGSNPAGRPPSWASTPRNSCSTWATPGPTSAAYGTTR